MALLQLDGGVNMDTLSLGDVRTMHLALTGANAYWLGDATHWGIVAGSGLTYSDGLLAGGAVTEVKWSISGGASFDLTGTSLQGSQVGGWLISDDPQALFAAALAGSDSVLGSMGADLIRGYGGADQLIGGLSGDTIYGGDGDDTIYAFLGTVNPVVRDTGNYARGEDGDDIIEGGPGFDDLHGNTGNDTVSGLAGNDWVVGGQGDDSLWGDAGDDLVHGSAGNDAAQGGDGADQVLGGDGHDTLDGGAGADTLSGDGGGDVLIGGAGADVFQASTQSFDGVRDFSILDGDRVQVTAGTQYTLTQVGSEVHIQFGNTGTMVLYNVWLADLPDGWIFAG